MDSAEREQVAEQFGVAPEQVERDHLTSHLLAFLSQMFGDRNALAADLDAALPRAVARTHGRITMEPALSGIADTASAILRSSGGMSVRIQLLSSRDRVLWPAEHRVLVQRYSDAPPAELVVPTLAAFATSKTATWADRRAPRDLWDLWALSVIGAIDDIAADLYIGVSDRPISRPRRTYLKGRPPKPSGNHNSLARPGSPSPLPTP